MKRIFTFITAALAFSLMLPVRAQTQINAPAGWRVRSKTGEAKTYTPPDLRAGEIYSVTIYDSVSMNDKTLEGYLRAFAGKVGKSVGQLAAPLRISTEEGRVVSGMGVYHSPNGRRVSVIFVGITSDGGQSIHMERVLFSSDDVVTRYESQQNALGVAMAGRAKAEAGGGATQSGADVLQIVRQKLRPGGDIVPGVYVGNRMSDGELRNSFRVYIYPGGEYRITDRDDKDYKNDWGDVLSVGQFSYDRKTGKLELDRHFDLNNDTIDPDTDFCFYGRNAAGKPAIYAEHWLGSTLRTSLVWAGPPTKRESPGAAKAREAAAEAEKKRYKWVVAPGKGVQNAQIAMLWNDYHEKTYYGGTGGIGINVTDDTYLLLKDGTIHAGLPVAPDQLDLVRSRQNEPQSWGHWRGQNGKMQVSWDGGPYQPLLGEKVLPAPAQTRLTGRYGTGRSSANMISGSYSLWGVTFDPNGRFIKDGRGGSSSTPGYGDQATHTNSGYDDEGSFVGSSGPNFALSSEQKKKNPNGAREGDYSLNGYVLTLRLDNGQVKRLPFFFGDASRKSLWFEGASLSLDDKK